MAYNYQQVPFWDFARAFNNGAGVDHPAGGFAFFGPQGGPEGFSAGWGAHRGRGRHGHRGRSHERSREGCAPANPENTEGEAREEFHGPHGPHGPHGRRGGWGGPGRGGWPGHHGAHPFAGPGGFDLSALVESLSAHPLAQAFRTYAEQATQQSGETAAAGADNENSFVPPVDIFATETEYVLHIAVPGAKKEDVGVNFDADKGELNVAGVIYRPGNEEFLKTLSQSERKVGVFERTVKIPPTEHEKEEVDGEAITAKMEDGVLIVTIPKVEKEWTDVKRVDIE